MRPKQTEAGKAVQEAREVARNALAWRARERVLLAASYEKPFDEPGDEAACRCGACGLPMPLSPPEHGVPGAWWCSYCGEY